MKNHRKAGRFLRAAGTSRRRTALAGAVLLAGLPGGFATPAQAMAIAYSQGILDFAGVRTVTVGAGGDYATCDAAVKSFPKGGSGGVIEFLPGTHTTTCGAISKRGDFLLTGRLGPNGERPRITTPTSTKVDGSTVHAPFLVFHSDKPDNLVVQNLELFDTGRAISAWNYGGMVMRNVKIDDTNGADAVKAYPTHNFETEGYKWDSWLEIYDSEVSRGGSGNARHNLYIGRIDRVLIDGLYTHSAQASHAYKSIAHDQVIRNSTFATSDLDYVDALGSRYLSTTLVDISACSNSLIENNTFIGMRVFPSDRPGLPGAGALGVSTASFIDLKRRKSKVGGCDEPRFEDAVSFDWAAAAADGYNPTNDALFQHVIRNNSFINAGEHDMLAIRNVGTAYIEDNGISFTRGRDLPLPPGWFERAVAWLDDNTFSGAAILPGEEWTDHPGYPYGAPIFIDGIRIGDQPDPRVPVTVAFEMPGGVDNGGAGSSVTEPATVAMVGLGLLAVGLMQRRT